LGYKCNRMAASMARFSWCDCSTRRRSVAGLLTASIGGRSKGCGFDGDIEHSTTTWIRRKCSEHRDRNRKRVLS
jgi:hypothetical protein